VFKPENLCQKEYIPCFNNVKDYKFAMKIMEMKNEDDYGAQLLMRKVHLHYTITTSPAGSQDSQFTHKPSKSKFQTRTSVILFKTAREKFYENCTLYHRSDLNGYEVCSQRHNYRFQHLLTI